MGNVQGSNKKEANIQYVKQKEQREINSREFFTNFSTHQ